MLPRAILSLALLYTVSGHCNTFKNTEIEIEVYKSNSRKAVNITGCVERIQPGFDGEIIEKFLVKDQKIVRLHKDTVRNMARLRKMWFQNCEIEEVEAEAFRNLPRMKEVRLVKNKIRKLAGETFGRGMPLEILDLSENTLVELESFKGVESLKILNLRTNSLENLNEDLLANCTNLEEINLAVNKLSAIPDKLFSKNPKLRHIDLRSNKFTALNFQPFTHLRALNNLFLSKNFLTDISLPSAFALNKLDIAANFLNSLPQSFDENLNVKFLLLTGNPLLCNCVPPIKNMLMRSEGVLKDLNGCGGFPVCVFPKILSETCRSGEHDEEATKRFFANVAGFKPRMTHCYNAN